MEGLEILISTVKSFFDNFDDIYKKVISNPQYSGVTKDEVMKIYNSN